MADKQVRGDKIWRSAALAFLCLLVYYFSYDHGRQSMRPKLEAVEKQAIAELSLQRREIVRLQAALAECGRDAPADEPLPLNRFPLKINESKILFGGRLVVTLLEVDNPENKARIQLNFIEQERLLAKDLIAGGSLRFAMDGRSWAVVVSALSLSTANLNLVELKNDPERHP